MPDLTAYYALPAWYRNLPGLVLSILLLLCGLGFIPGLVDLHQYLWNTSPPETGTARPLILSFFIGATLIGGAGTFSAATGHWKNPLLILAFSIGSAAIFWGMWYSIYAYPLAPWNQ